MRDPALIQVTGPLAPFAEGFGARLELLGYARQSQAGHLRLMADLSRWLVERRLDGSGLSSEAVARFVLDRRAAGRRDARSARSLRPLLEYLREAGAAPAVTPPLVVGQVEVMLADYASYLSRERGLAEVTVRRETDLVRPFLAARIVGEGDVLGLDSLTAGEVTGFMLARSGSASPATVQRTGTALRSLLRFLHLRGVIGASLVGAVPTAANWRLAGLPKYLTAEQAGMLLASCDLATAVGRRDLAILTLLARLGLRAGEVAVLTLDDIDWRRGEITVRGKGDRHERLPLPADVGEAVVAYLQRGRPPRPRTGRCSPGPGPAPGADRGRRSPRWWPARHTGPGWGRSTRTGCGTPRPPRCCAPGRRWPRSGRCCGTGAPLSTADLRQGGPRARCARWPGPGRVRHA